MSKLGISLLLITAVIIILLIFILIIRFLCGNKMSEANRSRLESIKSKLFYNPLIRYAFLNSLKFNFTAVTTFQQATNDSIQLIIAIIFFIAASIIPLILSRVLFKLNNELNSDENKKKFGSMY